MITSLLIAGCTIGVLYLFATWLLWHEAEEEQRLREAKHRHPTNTSYSEESRS